MRWFHWAINRISSYDWEKIGESAFDTILYVVTVIVVARILYWVLEFILRHALVGRKLGTIIKENKSNTIYSLLRSMLFYIITFTVIIDTMKRIFSFDTSTLLASVSVLGVALGFGSQSLVKDVIGGFFILFEDQFSVGETVKIGEFTGKVIETGIRTTRIRADEGEINIVPNGSITTVTNYSRGNMLSKVEVQIPYEEDIAKAIEVITTVCEELTVEFADIIIEAPQVLGVTKFAEHNAIVRITAYTLNDKQRILEREIRIRVHSAFLEKGIRTPQNQNIIYTDLGSNI